MHRFFLLMFGAQIAAAPLAVAQTTGHAGSHTPSPPAAGAATSADRAAIDHAIATVYPSLVRIFAVVCQSGAAETNKWIEESRNIAADYERAYGKTAPRVKGLRLQINSQHTGTVAESYFGEVAFRSTLQ